MPIVGLGQRATGVFLQPKWDPGRLDAFHVVLAKDRRIGPNLASVNTPVVLARLGGATQTMAFVDADIIRDSGYSEQNGSHSHISARWH